jgi:hypothetical protein
MNIGPLVRTVHNHVSQRFRTLVSTHSTDLGRVDGELSGGWTIPMSCRHAARNLIACNGVAGRTHPHGKG